MLSCSLSDSSSPTKLKTLASTPLAFEKYEGAGNDFVIVLGEHLEDGVTLPVDRICDRHFGIGADGFIVVSTAEGADYEMKYYNADGAIGSMCGNGARCAFLFARANGLAGEHATFIAFDGIHTASILKDGTIAISMQDVPEVRLLGPDTFETDTGSPHYIRFVPNLNEIDVVSEGRSVRYSSPYARQGINVNFVERRSDSLRMSTYERGVENMTLACGTGATAVALAEAVEQELESGRVVLDADGGRLAVSFQRRDSAFVNIVLEGPARHVFSGIYRVP